MEIYFYLFDIDRDVNSGFRRCIGISIFSRLEIGVGVEFESGYDE